MNARAVASACAKLGLECEVHIGAVDAEKVSLNKDITELYGAKIIECHDSTKTLLPAMAAALRSGKAIQLLCMLLDHVVDHTLTHLWSELLLVLLEG